MSAQPNVVLESSYEMDEWDQIRPVLEEYSIKLGVEIFVKNPHGGSSTPKNEEGKLFIYFWSCAEKYRHTVLDSAYGMRLKNGYADACEPSGLGTVIFDPDGVAVAEVVEGTLYVLFDLPHYDSPARELLQSIMEAFVQTYQKPKKYYSWKNFVEIFRRRDGLLEMNRTLIHQRYDDLKKAAKGNLKVEKDKIIVTLGPIIRTREDDYGDLKHANLGKYSLVIFPKKNEVEIYPSRKRDLHPHVFANGDVCWGNAFDAMHTFVMKREFDLAVQLAEIFLEAG